MENTASLTHYYLLQGCNPDKKVEVERAAHRLNGLRLSGMEVSTSDPAAYVLTLTFLAPASDVIVDDAIAQMLAPLLVSASRVYP